MGKEKFSGLFLENSDETMGDFSPEGAMTGMLLGGFVQALQDGVAGAKRGARQPTTVYNKVATDKLIAEMNQDIDKAKALATGAMAQNDVLQEALRKLDPAHPLLQASGQRFQDGKQKTKLRLIFEVAFDNFLAGKGYLMPQTHRKN